MLIELSQAEMCFIRQATREFRTVPPEHVESDEGKLERWREERTLYDVDRISVDRKMVDALAATMG